MLQDRIVTCTSCSTRFVWSTAEPGAEEAPFLCPGCRLILPKPGRQRGVVKFYSVRKHWGFITQADGRELFFHRSAWPSQVEPVPREGDLVEYAVEGTQRGPQAVELDLLDPAQPATGASA